MVSSLSMGFSKFRCTKEEEETRVKARFHRRAYGCMRAEPLSQFRLISYRDRSSSFCRALFLTERRGSLNEREQKLLRIEEQTV